MNGSIFSAKRDSNPPQQPNLQSNHQFNHQTNISFNIDSSSLNSLIVSDSIFLWTDDQSLASLLTLIDAVKHIIRTNFFWEFGFPLRGGISMGSVTFQKVDWDSPKINSIATIVGDALVKAAMIEKTGAEIVSAECSACRMQINNSMGKESTTIFKNPIELIAEALRK